MNKIILPHDWRYQPAYLTQLAPPFQRIPFAVNLINGAIPQNVGCKGQLAVTLTGTNVQTFNAEGVGLTNGTGGVQFGASGAFNAWTGANSPFWITWVFQHGNYVNSGSSANIIWSLGNASAPSGFFAQINSSQTLSVRLANTSLNGPVLTDGQTYRCVAGRDGTGNCWLWIDGKLIATGASATASVSRQLCLLRDEAATRYFQGALNMLAFGSENPASFGLELSKNPWKVFAPANGPIILSVSAAQTLTQSSRLDNSQTFYSPTVTPGPVTLSPSLFSNSNTFYSAKVSHVLTQSSRLDNSQTFYGPQINLTLNQGSRFDNAQTFYGPTATPGPVTLSPSRLDNSQTFYGPSVAFRISPPRLDNSQTFYGPTVTPGAVTLSPERLDNTQTFYGPKVSHVLNASRFDNSQTFHSPTVTPGAVTLSPGRLDNTQSFYSATVTPGAVTLSPERLDNSNTFYGPVVTNEQNIRPPRLESTVQFFGPTVSASNTLLPGILSNTNSFFSASIIQYSGPATITGVAVDRLAEIWARLGMDSTRPVANTSSSITLGVITQTAATTGSTRTGAKLIASESAETMVQEIWQRLGLDPDNPLVQTATTLEFGAVQCNVTTSGGTVTVARQ